MTDQELKDLVASLAISQAETDKQMKETTEQFRKLAIESDKTTEQMKKTDERLDKQFKRF